MRVLDQLYELAKAAKLAGLRVGNLDPAMFIHHAEALEGPVIGERLLARFNQHYPWREDAEFIVAACKAHSALVAVARAAEALNNRRICHGRDAEAENNLNDALAALAKLSVTP